ncbi:MAG: DUF503 family protein [Eubacteriales bacterium]|nr:DUF503 family protein [Eubacteriales bacterium]
MSQVNGAVRIVSLEVSLDLICSFSLKDKRKLRQRLLDRLKAKYNISIIESDLQDDYRRLELFAAYVALNESSGIQLMERIQDYIFTLIEGEAILRNFYYELH